MKKKYQLLVLLISLLAPSALLSQNLTQTIRGVILDKVSQSPLPGAVVMVANSQPLIAAACDADGRFSLANVPVGKQSLKVNYLGYKPVTLNNLSVNAGKELVLTINMEEDVTQMTEVEVTARVQKNKALNDMSSVSTRAFSVEETQKFAAAFNDPARMANSFAGVVQGTDGNNHISIRGNSPNGLIWRMEGVDIPNPNHFSSIGTSGGGVSILSSQLLNNSDFSTGAFAAEYGNALSGVFDLKLRKGNNQKREYTAQLGLLGADIALEGPFKKGYEGSYLVNYRYSTLSLLAKVGVPLGDAVTNFQDLSYNISLPTKKFGTFSLFGFGGLSFQRVDAKKDSLEWKQDDFTQYTAKFYSNTGATGLTHTKLLNSNSYIKTILSVSGTQNGEWYKKMQHDYSTFKFEGENNFNQWRVTLSSTYTQKLSSRSNLRSGFIANHLGYRLLKQAPNANDKNIIETRVNEKGSTQTLQGFVQLKHKLTNKLTANVGAHYLHLALNNSNSFEPRASLIFEPNNKNTITFGYGLHGQVQPIVAYFARHYIDQENYSMPNKGLGISKAHHLVLGYDRVLTDYSHIKIETYYQHLFDIPVSQDKTDNYSMINMFDNVSTRPLINKGLGKNYGAELTYERFLHRDFYYLVSGSLYESKFRTLGGKWFNSRFNTNYALTITLGKEWNISSSRKNRYFGFNLKSVLVGGYRYTPIDLQASIASGETQVYTDRMFEEKVPAYYRLDTRVSLKRNYRHLTSTLALDIQNTTNRKNPGGQYFNATSGKIEYWYQAPLIPILSYRLEF